LRLSSSLSVISGDRKRSEPEARRCFVGDGSSTSSPRVSRKREIAADVLFLSVLAADVDFTCAAKDVLFAAAVGKADRFLENKVRKREYRPCLFFRRDERLGLWSCVLTICCCRELVAVGVAETRRSVSHFK